MKLINIKDRTIIGKAMVMIPEEWTEDEADHLFFEDGIEVPIYEGDDGDIVPALRVGINHDYDEFTCMAYAFAIPEEDVYEIQLGTPVWWVHGWDEANERHVHEKFYVKEEAYIAMSCIENASKPIQQVEYE